MNDYCRIRAVTALALLAAGGVVHAQTDHSAHAAHRAMLEMPGGAPVAAHAEAIDLPAVTLLTQRNEPIGFVDEAIGNDIVIIDFAYTTCTTVCPVLSAILGQVQDELGERLGTDIRMVSVTVDPMRDTPARLLEYSSKHDAGEDWLWLTGSREDIREVLEAFGAYTPNFEDHPSIVLVGDGQSNAWVRLLGFPSVDQIIRQVDALSAHRSMNVDHGAHAGHH